MSRSDRYSLSLVREPDYIEIRSFGFGQDLRRLYDVCEHLRTSRRWEKDRRQDGCTIYYAPVGGSSYLSYRVVMLVRTRTTPREFLRFVEDATIDLDLQRELLPHLEPGYMYYRSLSSFGPGLATHVIHHREDYRLMFVSHRDFVTLRQMKRVDGVSDTYVMYGGSFGPADGPPYPKEESSVQRGTISAFMWRVSRSTDILRIEYVNHTDPGGMIPGKLFSMILKTQALRVARYWNVFLHRKRDGLPVSSRRRAMETTETDPLLLPRSPPVFEIPSVLPTFPESSEEPSRSRGEEETRQLRAEVESLQQRLQTSEESLSSILETHHRVAAENERLKEVGARDVGAVDVSLFPSVECQSVTEAEEKLQRISDLLGRVRKMEEALLARKAEIIGRRELLKRGGSRSGGGRSDQDRGGENLCVICWERPRSVLLFPCKHLCLCSECVVQECPICRTGIVDRVEGVFVS